MTPVKGFVLQNWINCGTLSDPDRLKLFFALGTDFSAHFKVCDASIISTTA